MEIKCSKCGSTKYKFVRMCDINEHYLECLNCGEREYLYDEIDKYAQV